jgi:putative membrane protein
MVEEVTMENMRNHGIWMSKSRAIAAAAFFLAAGAGGRVMADPTAQAQGPTGDAGIARWVVAINQAEEQASAAVRGKLVSAAVWQLADRIAVDHAALDREFRGLAPGGPASIRDTAVDAKADRVDLSKLSGDELEKGYVDREVRFHEAMLATLERDLIPSASSLALRDRLFALRTVLESELQHARNVQHAAWVRQTAAQERADIAREISNEGP